MLPHAFTFAYLRRGALVLLASVAAIGQGCSHHQAEYASPDQAVQSLVTAVRTEDKDSLRRIFGPEAEDILKSGDPVDDRNRAHKFLALYDEKHHLVDEPDGRVTLVVGKDDWPMPVPIVKDDKGKRWRFDPDAGKEEILNRRIGRNELDVIQVCKAIVDAQHDFAEIKAANGGVPEYAQKFLSDAGQKNGLYWPTAEGEPQSPLGPRVADAVEEGYSATGDPDAGPRPYHGYYYRMLTRQGVTAQGGSRDYLVNGRMIAGFAVVAWPADYGNSGIMTFIVNQDGVVYQRDLGDDTDKLARAMQAFDPGPGWTKSE